MKRHSRLREWLAPALFIALAALLTWPWTIRVLMAAYERDVNEKVDRLAQRVKLQLSTAWYWSSPQQVMESLKAEILGDTSVQAVCFLDFSRKAGGYVRKNDNIPVPRSREDVERMMEADPSSYRKSFYWGQKGDSGMRGIIYLDLSRAELKRHFWESEGPLIWKIGSMTCVAFIFVSAVGIYAYRIWGSAERARLRAELEQQGLLAERGLTAAVLAHEIRNPLGALRFQLHSLKKHPEDAQRVATTGALIDAELSRIQQLVNDYLAHEKAQNMQVEAVDVGEAVRGLHSLMAEPLKEAGTKLIMDAPEKVTVACDPHALRQILINLVINAQQAMGRGGEITIRTQEAGGYGTISVSDTGPGIPEEMKDRLFKPFQTNKKEGSGLGLALVKRFADNFGGTVTVESEPGKGATFHLRLPLAGREIAALVLQYERPAEAKAV